MAKTEEGHGRYCAFNHLIGPGQDRQAERVGRPAVHRDFASGRLLDRQFGRPRALQDLVDASVAPVKATAACAGPQGFSPDYPRDLATAARSTAVVRVNDRFWRDLAVDRRVGEGPFATTHNRR
jgi:hypothetical protein